MGHRVTRATFVWIIGAAVVGAAAGTLHLLRGAFGEHNAMALAVATFALTLVAAIMLYRGLMVAAGEQDAAAPPTVPDPPPPARPAHPARPAPWER